MIMLLWIMLLCTMTCVLLLLLKNIFRHRVTFTHCASACGKLPALKLMLFLLAATLLRGRGRVFLKGCVHRNCGSERASHVAFLHHRTHRCWVTPCHFQNLLSCILPYVFALFDKFCFRRNCGFWWWFCGHMLKLSGCGPCIFVNHVWFLGRCGRIDVGLLAWVFHERNRKVLGMETIQHVSWFGWVFLFEMFFCAKRPLNFRKKNEVVFNGFCLRNRDMFSCCRFLRFKTWVCGTVQRTSTWSADFIWGKCSFGLTKGKPSCDNPNNFATNMTLDTSFKHNTGISDDWPCEFQQTDTINVWFLRSRWFRAQFSSARVGARRNISRDDFRVSAWYAWRCMRFQIVLTLRIFGGKFIMSLWGSCSV